MSMVTPTGVNMTTFPYTVTPIADIQPFSYQAGLTYQEVLTNLRDWLTNVLVPYVNTYATSDINAYNTAQQVLATAMDNFNTTAAADIANINNVLAEVNSALANATTEANNAASSATTASTAATNAANSATAAASSATDAANSATAAAATTDTTVANLVDQTGSQTQSALDTRFAVLQTDRGREYLETKRTIGLREWFRALGNRTNARANWMGLGDSISERRDTSMFRNAWQNVAKDVLRSKIPTPGAVGGDAYIPSIVSYAASTFSDWPYNYSASGWVRDLSKGIGIVSTDVSPGGVVTLNIPAGHTAVDLFYGKNGGNPGTRALTVAMDGGAGTILDCVGSTLDFIPYRITLPDTNAHTITVTGSGSSSAAIFDGVYLYNGDESKGIGVWVNGQSSMQAAAVVNNYLPIFGQQVSQVQPSLFTLEFGANDYQNGTPTTAATFKTNMQAIISTIKSNCTRPPSIVLMVPWTWTPGVTPVETGGWAAFVDVLYEIAAADDDICVFDMQQRMTLMTTSDSASDARGLISSTDNIHPSDAGSWMLGYALAEFLTP